MWLAYLGLIVLAHVRSIRVGREGSICVLPCRTHIEITYVSPSLGPYGQPIWDWLCFLMCDSYGSAIKCPYVFTHSEPIYRSTMCVLPWAHVGSLYGSDCVCTCVTHMGWPWGPHMCLPIQNPYTDQPCESYLGLMWAAYMGLIVFAHVWLIWVGHEVHICVYPFRTHIQINHVSPTLGTCGQHIWVWLCLLMCDSYGLAMRSPYVFTHSEPIYRSTMCVLPWAHVGSLYGSDCVCSCVTHMGWPWGPHMCLPIQNPYTDQPCESYLGLMWAAYMGLIVFSHVWLIWVGHEVHICVYPFRTHIQINHVSPTLGTCGQHIWVWLCLLMCDSYGLAMRSPYVFTHSEPIYRSTMCVLPWAHVGSLYGSDCVCSCVTHMGWPWGPHMCLPIQNPYTDQPCESYLGLMWAAYMGLIVFSHVWLIWVGHEVHICVYPSRTHIQINHVSPTLGTCGQHIWVWLCLLMSDSYGLAMRSPYVFTHSEPIYRSTMCVLPWAHVGSLYGSDCVCSCVTHMGWPWGPHMCLPIQNWRITNVILCLIWIHVLTKRCRARQRCLRSFSWPFGLGTAVPFVNEINDYWEIEPLFCKWLCPGQMWIR